MEISPCCFLFSCICEIVSYLQHFSLTRDQKLPKAEWLQCGTHVLLMVLFIYLSGITHGARCIKIGTLNLLIHNYTKKQKALHMPGYFILQKKSELFAVPSSCIRKGYTIANRQIKN